MRKTYLVMDIETVPDPDLYKAPDTPAGTERPFPPLYTHKPIVIGCLLLDADYQCQRLGIIGEEREPGDEPGLLFSFSSYVDDHRPHLVTFNGRAFDLPVLALRCLRQGVPMRWFYQNRDYRYRFSEEGSPRATPLADASNGRQGHLDLCDFLSEHGAARGLSLDAAARLIGLPGKVGVDGSQVEGLWNAGQRRLVEDYCLSDVAQTAFLFLRFRLLTGALDIERYRRVARALYETLQADGRCGPLFERLDRARLLLEPPFGGPGPAAEAQGQR